jgi:outer membrane protein assembly factor BamB
VTMMSPQTMHRRPLPRFHCRDGGSQARSASEGTRTQARSASEGTRTQARSASAGTQARSASAGTQARSASAETTQARSASAGNSRVLSLALRACVRTVSAFLMLLFLWAGNSSAGEVIGWRTDGSGSYPKAQPPLEWSTEKNVVWRTAMPGASNSIPVLLGRRIYNCAEPATLLCLDRDTGRILWQKTSSYDELKIAAEVRKQLAVELAEVEQLTMKEKALGRELDALRRKLKADGTGKEETEKQSQPLRKQIEALKAEKAKLTVAERYTEPRTHSYAGYSTPTPVTNGREFFVAFGNGLVACYDLEGKRRWLKLIEHSTAAFAHASSPVLVGDRLVVHFADLVALDTKDGSECWRVKLPPSHGTPLATRVGDVDVLLTPRGSVFRVKDGALLANRLGECGANSPILHRERAFYIRNSATAVRLPQSFSMPLKVEPLWKARVQGNGYWFCSPVIHEGLIYASTDKNIFSVLDAETGKVVYEERLPLSGTGYPSVSVAGDRVYVSSDRGETVVLRTGRAYRELARNTLEPFRSSMVFAGKRLYVRTLKHLYCIGE